MSMRNAIAGLLLCCAVLAVPAVGAVQAQQANAPPNALQGFSQNRNEPINIDANSLEFQNEKKMATYTGRVHLVQGDTTLRCKTLIVYFESGDQAGAQGGAQAGAQAPAVKPSAATTPGGGKIRLMKAIGQVVVVQKDQTATGDQAIYDMATNSVTLSASAGGFVAVTQGPNIVRGPRLVVHLGTGVSHFEGGRIESLFVPGANKAGNAKSAPATDAQATPAPAPTPQKPRPSNTGGNNTNGLY
jgi:lipopolysaccharide export system protein LptA